MESDAVQVSKEKSRKIWLLTILCTLGTMVCSSTIVLAHVGYFITPLEDDFSWSRGEISLSLSIAAISMALANPFVGRAIDKFGVGPVLITSLITYSAALFSLPFLTNEFGLPGLYVGFAMVAAFGAGSNVIAYVRILSGWFVGKFESRRGLALGMAMAGIPLGSLITGPSSILMIEYIGWANALRVLSALPVVLGIPIALTIVRARPLADIESASSDEAGKDSVVVQRPRGAFIADTSKDIDGMSVSEAMSTPQFWIMVLAAVMMSTCLQGVMTHIVPYMSDMGASAATLALLSFVTAPVGILGRVGAGFFFDRYFAPWVAVIIFGAAAAGAFSMGLSTILIVAFIAAILLNFGAGAESDFIGYVIGKYFGLKNYGQIFGIIYGGFMVGIAIGPYLVGVGFDYFGDYQYTFLAGGCGLLLLCALLMFLPKFTTSEVGGERVAR